MNRRAQVVSLTIASFAIVAAQARAQEQIDRPFVPGLQNVGVDERLGAQVPLDVAFRDQDGRRVVLRDLLDGERPVVLNFGYHTCPSTCSLVLDATASALARQEWSVGEDVIAIAISVDPRDTVERAAHRRRRALRRYRREGAEGSWHYLIAEETLTTRELLVRYGANPPAERVARAVGFDYEWKAREEEYAHPAVTVLLTPDGRVARYLYGLEHRTEDMRLGLYEAAEGRSVPTLGRIEMFCYRYDPTRGEYVIAAENVMKVGGGLVALTLASFLLFLWRRELRKKHPSPSAVSAGAE
jgi:protein SCO1/2